MNHSATGGPTRLSPVFYRRPTLELARALLGVRFYRRIGQTLLCGRIVETEAYHQDGDAAAHSFRGRTRRNAVMFGDAGLLYVYLSYGIHYCMNVVSEAEGVGAAVLIRAIEPLEGLQHIQSHRGARIGKRDLTNGPGKCCAAFAVDLSHNGADLQRADLFLAEGGLHEGETVTAGPRIGISKSTELPWRFHITDNPFVSRFPKKSKKGRGD